MNVAANLVKTKNTHCEQQDEMSWYLEYLLWLGSKSAGCWALQWGCLLPNCTSLSLRSLWCIRSVWATRSACPGCP